MLDFAHTLLGRDVDNKINRRDRTLSVRDILQ